MGIFYIQLGYGPTWSHPHKQDPLLLVFFNYVKAFSIYLKYVQRTFLCDHSCICRNSFYWPYRCPIYVQFGQFCCGNGLRASLGRPESPPGMLFSTLRQSSRAYQLAYAQQQLPKGDLQGCSKSLPWRVAVEIVQTLHSEASRSSAEHFVAHWSIEPNQSHVSSMQRLAGEFPPGNKWLSALGVHTGKSLLSQLWLQGKFQFHFYNRLTS